MKKSMTLVMCALLVVVSLVSGVFALYSSSLDDVNTGSVVAKNFVLTGDTTDEFGNNVKLAPGESKDSTFTVANYDSNGVTETAMKVTVDITLNSQIEPLVLQVIDTRTEEVVAELNSTTTTGQYTFEFAAGEPILNEYEVVATWPEGTEGSDNQYIGKKAQYNISVKGVQLVN